MLKEWKYGIISLSLFLLLLIIGMVLFKPTGDQQKITWVEDQLNKTHSLSLLAGEKYTYSYSFGNGTMNISYLIKGSGECVVIDIVNGSEQPVCVNSHGNDKNMSNLSLGIPFLNIFRPWMLAVRDGWHWNVKGKTTIGGLEYVFDEINFTVLGKENFKGREAYKIVMRERVAPAVYFLVDNEKRVLLREYSEKYDIAIVSAPFALEQ